MNTTPAANRLTLGIFGKRNTGKSSLINALCGQNLAIVSDIPGTTTDPVGKAWELGALGPVMIYDTAGLDDSGDLGKMRIEKSRTILRKTDLVLYVVTNLTFDSGDEKEILDLKKQLPLLLVMNKMDESSLGETLRTFAQKQQLPLYAVSAKTQEGIDAFRKELMTAGSGIRHENPTILGDLIRPGDFVLLVVPIDLGAPKGRLILPQVQVIRDILDQDAVPLVVKERELEYTLQKLSFDPALVVCDSQVVLKVAGDLPSRIPLTTFSILFSRLKGDLASFVKGVRALDSLKDKDRVLMMETCTHHASSDDIGRVKIPRWIRQYTGKDLIFDVNSGPYLHKDLAHYQLIIACGGCMIHRREMLSRIEDSQNLKIPITNYGVAISFCQGVLDRVIAPFKELLETEG